jgi:penicillin-binding protein 2
MQQLVLYGALATSKVWRPQVVQRIEDPSGETIQEFGPIVRHQIPIQQETREAVLKGLEAAVNEPFGTGYGTRLKDFMVDGQPLVAAGKTGTAQVVKLGAKRLKAAQVSYFERDHAWFAAFAPSEDPEIVVVVLNEHSGFGASNAAPTAAAIIRYYFQLKRQDAMERAGVPVGPPPPPGPAVPVERHPAPPASDTPGVVPASLQGDKRGA